MRAVVPNLPNPPGNGPALLVERSGLCPNRVAEIKVIDFE